MPLFGPRLDSPSAVGDEGRSRATSLAVASLTAAGLAGVIGYLGEITGVFLAVAATAGFFTLSLALVNRDRFIALFLGQLLFLFAGSSLIVVGVGLLFVSPAYGLLLGGFALAAVGLGAAWANVGNADDATTALVQGAGTLLASAVWWIVVAIFAVVLLGAGFLLGPTAGPAGAVTAALLAAFVTCVSTYFGLRWLPYEQLSPPTYRGLIAKRLGQFRVALGVVAALAVTGFVVTLGAVLAGVFARAVAAVPALGAVLEVLGTPALLAGPVLVGALVLVGGVLALTTRRATRPVDARANRVLSVFLSAFVFVVLFVPFLLRQSLLPAVLLSNPIAAILLILLAPPLLLATVTVLILAVKLGVMPDRAGGQALAATGLIVAAVGAAIAGAPTPLALGCVAGAMLVWDASTFGLGVTAELGHLPETRRLELFHAVVGVGVAIAAVALTWGIWLAREFVPTTGNVVAVALALAGVLCLLVPLRG